MDRYQETAQNMPQNLCGAQGLGWVIYKVLVTQLSVVPFIQ